MKRIKGEVLLAAAVIYILMGFGFLEAQATHDCATNALVKSASCK